MFQIDLLPDLHIYQCQGWGTSQDDGRIGTK